MKVFQNSTCLTFPGEKVDGKVYIIAPLPGHEVYFLQSGGSTKYTKITLACTKYTVPTQKNTAWRIAKIAKIHKTLASYPTGQKPTMAGHLGVQNLTQWHEWKQHF